MYDNEDHPDYQNPNYNWVSDFVYGGIDGAVTTFAVVAGVEGASLSIPIILILGFANLFADGFSMASGKYLSDKAEIEQYERIRQIEYRHLQTKTEYEREEVREIMANYGFQGADLDRGIEIVTSNPDKWVDIMMRHEFNMTLENVNPIKGALATFIAFITIGFIPLLGYTIRPILPMEITESGIFMATIMATAIALFIVGTIKSRFTMQKWYWAGLETLLIGSLAATVAYMVGYLLSGLA